ncbi:MAG: tetratricopeptide repeat protein [Novosphingobium sp.]|nr:tetratricopeptide repeat protein [Novosphingobium sp.]
MRLRRLACAASALALGCAGASGQAIAQDSGKSVSYPVVQPLPSRQSLQLNAALSKLGRNPRDLDALIDAGNAALAMGDVDAAFGFFGRADQISSANPQVKAGLASAMVRKGDPVGAIALFDQAEKAGAKASEIAPDRGLAHDLIGDSVSAQRLYHLALTAGPDDEITRRLALSLAISGDRPGMEMTLLPLLRKQDKGAWRTRAFALAIMGRTDEAVRLAKTILPERLATDMAPYLRYMPRLTPAQQAAAANLGDFPRASEIGRDDPRIAQAASEAAKKPVLASADAGLVPRGAPLGVGENAKGTARQDSSRQEKKEGSRSRPASSSKKAAVQTAPPEPQPARQAGPIVEPVLALAPSKPPQPAAAASAPEADTSSAELAPASGVVQAETTAKAPATLVASQPEAATEPGKGTLPAAGATPAAKPVPGPGFDLAGLPNSRVSGPAGEPPLQSQQETVAADPLPDASEEPLSLAEAFGDLGKPVTSAAPAAGAVDIRKITPAKPPPPPVKAEPPKPPPPSHPSRIWVQLGIGRDKAAMAFDWRRLARKAPEVFHGRKPYVSEMGQTNRMLTGPFESAAAANKFIGELREADIDGPYVWTSPAGQVVDALPGR